MIPKRIVIDTNVCLDLFVFHDRRWQALLQAMEEGSVLAYTRHDCRTEWLKVLEYRHLPLDADSRAAAIAQFDQLIDCVEVKAAGTPLPLCTDPDDQKFLELARDIGADLLITKDKALLKLARKIARAGLYSIRPPEQWLAERRDG